MLDADERVGAHRAGVLRGRDAQVDGDAGAESGEQADPVIAFAAVVEIVAERAIVARGFGQEVVAVAAVKLVRAEPAAQRVVAVAADEHVVAGAACEHVVAREDKLEQALEIVGVHISSELRDSDRNAREAVNSEVPLSE